MNRVFGATGKSLVNVYGPPSPRVNSTTLPRARKFSAAVRSRTSLRLERPLFSHMLCRSYENKSRVAAALTRWERLALYACNLMRRGVFRIVRYFVYS